MPIHLSWHPQGIVSERRKVVRNPADRELERSAPAILPLQVSVCPAHRSNPLLKGSQQLRYGVCLLCANVCPQLPLRWVFVNTAPFRVWVDPYTLEPHELLGPRKAGPSAVASALFHGRDLMLFSERTSAAPPGLALTLPRLPPGLSSQHGNTSASLTVRRALQPLPPPLRATPGSKSMDITLTLHLHGGSATQGVGTQLPSVRSRASSSCSLEVSLTPPLIPHKPSL
jgi:hypothetical protein